MIEDNDLPVNIDGFDSYRKARQFWQNLMFQITFERDFRGEIRQFIREESNVSMPIYRVRRFINVSHFENQSNETDGNPIYQCELHDIGKSLRVIQEAPTSNGLEIGAWINTHDDFRNYDELVLSLELNEKSYKVAKALVYYWFYVSDGADDMNEFIDRLW
ncbi:TPA: hypothetical protein ACMDVV_004637 [Vibrio parahaemolyticus]|nr:hypothetical protein [Vibrio parahaemolyticus]